MNPNITWDIVKENLERPWSWKELSFNPNMTMDIIMNNRDIPWVLDMLSFNRNVTWDFVQTHLDLPWKWDVLSAHSCIGWDVIKKNPQYPWSHYMISNNPNITIDIINEHPNHMWYWAFLAMNPHISLEDLENAKVNDFVIEYWYFGKNSSVTWNEYDKNRCRLSSMAWIYRQDVFVSDEDLVEHFRKVRSARKIEQAWLKCLYDPNFYMCKKRLQREFMELCV